MPAQRSMRLLRLAILLAAAALLPFVTAAGLRWAAQRQLDQASLGTLRDLAARQPDSAPVQHAYAARLLAAGNAAAAALDSTPLPQSWGQGGLPTARSNPPRGCQRR